MFRTGEDTILPMHMRGVGYSEIVSAQRYFYIFGTYFPDFDLETADGWCTFSYSQFIHYEIGDWTVYYHGDYDNHVDDDSAAVGEVYEYNLDEGWVTVNFSGS